MKRAGRRGQAQTEYVVIISVAAIGLIAIVGVVGLYLKWSYARSSGALTGVNVTAEDADSGLTSEELMAELDSAKKSRRPATSDGDADGDGGDSSGSQDLSASGPRGPMVGGDSDMGGGGDAYSDGEPIPSSAYGQSPSAIVMGNASGSETGEMAGFYAGSGPPKAGRAPSNPLNAKPFGFPIGFWILLLLFLFLIFFVASGSKHRH